MNDADKYYCMIQTNQNNNKNTCNIRDDKIQPSQYLISSFIYILDYLGYSRGNRDSGKSSSRFGQSNAGKLKSSGDSPKNPKMIKDVSARKINRQHCKPALQQQGRKGKHAFYLVQSVANFHFYSSVFCYLQFGWLNSCVYCVLSCCFGHAELRNIF